MSKQSSASARTGPTPLPAGRRGSALRRLAGLASLALTLPGCQSITGSQRLSQVRMIDASPDAPGLDMYKGSAVLAYNLGLGTVTSYVPVTPGGFPIIAETAGTRQQLVTASGTFLADSQYTALIGNFASNLQELILKDQSIPAPNGEISLRIIDQSTRAGAIDLYLVPAGSTIPQVTAFATGLIFNSNTGYLNLPTGTYTLVIVPAASAPTTKSATFYTGPAVIYPAGSARTLVLIDSATTTPSIRLVTATDYDPL